MNKKTSDLEWTAKIIQTHINPTTLCFLITPLLLATWKYLCSLHCHILIYRTCRALCSSREQTWSLLEMHSLPCAGLIPHRSWQAFPLSSPPSPNELKLLLSAVSKQRATYRMDYNVTSMVRNVNIFLTLNFVPFIEMT